MRTRIQHDGTVIVFIEDPPLFGEGASRSEAMADLHASMRELQRELRAAPSLAAPLQEQLATLDAAT